MLTFLWYCISLLLGLQSVLGNTEIVNFLASEDFRESLPFTDTWPTLRPTASTILLNVTSALLGSVLPQTICANLGEWRPERPQTCPHELWVVLDLDDGSGWKNFDKFTLRLSWPAFHPTDISMKIYNPTSLSSFTGQDLAMGTSSPSKTRRKYARIQLVHSGILTPTVVNKTNSFDDQSRYIVPVVLTLEPLHFGFLPSSVIPIALTILASIVVGLAVAAKINSYFQSIVQAAKKEMRGKQKIL